MGLLEYLHSLPVLGGVGDKFSQLGDTIDRNTINSSHQTWLHDPNAPRQAPATTPVMSPQVQDASTPQVSPVAGAIPAGVDQALNYIRSQTPQGQDIMQYYPALAYPGFLDAVKKADKRRPGLANLLLLQGFFESTLGKGGPTLFGTISGDRPDLFNNYNEALNYQLSPSVLGGGAHPNMNILNTDKPLTLDDIDRLYTSYDPPGAYIGNIHTALTENF